MLQKKTAPARSKAVGEEQQSRAAWNVGSSPKRTEEHEAVRGHRVPERGHTAVQTIAGYARQPQEYLPTRVAHPGRDHDVHLIGPKTLLAQHLLDDGLGDRKVRGDDLRSAHRRIAVVATGDLPIPEPH